MLGGCCGTDHRYIVRRAHGARRGSEPVGCASRLRDGVRHAEPADYGRVIARVNAWWGGRDMAPMLPRLFFVHFEGTSYVVDDEDGQLAAFLIGFLSQTDPEEAYIHFVGIAPERRGEGLGRHALRAVLRGRAAHGRTVVRCVTSPVNEGSVAFHQALGFEVEQVAKDYDGPGEDRVLFVKRLALARLVRYLHGDVRAVPVVAARPRRRGPRRPSSTLAVVARCRRLLAAAFGIVALLERDTIPARDDDRRRPRRGPERGRGARSVSEAAAAQRVTRPIALQRNTGRPMTTSGAELRGDARARRRALEALEAAAREARPRPPRRCATAPSSPCRTGSRRCVPPSSRTGSTRGSAIPEDAEVVVADDEISRGRGVARAPRVDRAALRRGLRTLPTEVKLDVVAARPVVTTRRPRRPRRRIERLLDGPRRVRAGDAEATLTPQRLRALVRTERADGDARSDARPEGPGRLAPDPARRPGGASAGRRLRGERQRARVVPSQPGRTLELARSRGRSRRISTRRCTARGSVKSPPAFTTEDGRGARDRGAGLGVHDVLPVLPAARDEHPARRGAARRHGRAVRARRSRSTRRSGSARSRTASSPRRRSSPAGSRTRSAAGSARSRRPCTTPPSSPA